MNLTYEEKDKYIYVKANQRKNYSSRKSIYFKTYNKNEKNIFEEYPIRPFQNKIPNDINLYKIFLFQKNSSQNINKRFLYWDDIKYSNNMNNLNRKKILYKIKEFLYRYNIDYKIYYKMILLYDIILIENEKKKLLTNDEIALGALVLSVKFNYIENKMVSMKKYLNIYDNKIYTLEHLIKIERICLHLANYCLNYYDPMCFLELFFINGIIFSTDSIKKDNFSKINHKVEQILEKIMEESNNYLKYNFCYLICSIVAFVREKYELEKWPYPLQKKFDIDFDNFKKEYNSLFNKENKYTDNNKEIIIKGNNNTILLNFPNNKNNNSNYELLSKSTSNFNLYQNSSHNLNNKYCNNIINININNFSIDNNNINSYLFKKNLNPKKSFDRFSLKKNETHLNLIHKFNYIKSKEINEEKNYGMKLLNTNIQDKNKNMSKTAYCSPDKKMKIKKYLKNRNIYKETEEENIKNSPNELINESNQIILDKKKNYNFSSRFKLNNSQSSYNINSFLFEKNQSNNEQNSKLVELKNTIKEYDKNKIRFKKSEITPKNLSINLGYTSGTKHNKAGKKILGMKEIVNSNVFVTRSKSKDNFKINFVKNDKDKKENKTRNKIRYNNLIKYKLSISSSSYKTKAFQY